MLQRVKYIDYLRKFSKRLNSILENIEKNKNEISDEDRDVIEATLDAYLKIEREN